MQLQFNKSTVRSLETVLQQVRGTELTQELRLPEGMPDIGRVLTTWGQVILRGKQWQDGNIQMTGGVMVWVLYAPEDGTEPRCVDSWIPFQLNWSPEDGKREGPVRLMPLLTFADSRSISARKLMVRAGVSGAVQAFRPYDAEVFTPGEIPEDLQLLRRTYPLRIPVEGGEKTFLVDEEVSLPDVGAEPLKLLCLTVSPEITEKRVLSDKVVFKGTLMLRPVCRYADGEIRSFDLPVPFSQLSELDGAYGPDAQTDIRMAVTSVESDMTQPGLIRLKCGMVAQYLIDDCHTLELVCDAYSPRRDVEIEESVLRIPTILDDRTEYIQAEHPIPRQTGRIADARFLPDYPGKRRTGNGLELELNGIFQTLLYDEEGVLQGPASRWEGNMKLSVDESCDPLVTVRPSGKVQTMSSADGMNLTTQLQITQWTGKTESIPMITAMELGQVKEPDPTRPSVILTAGCGDSLWELAKQSNSTVSAICETNGIEEDAVPEQMLLIPVM